MAERTERDSLGEVRVPADALWQAQTQRAVENFRISGRPMRPAFVVALARIKRAAAQANAELGQLDRARAEAIAQAAGAIIGGQHLEQFPVDVFQTGSGTSSNMNANEVIASLANAGLPEDSAVHPNDHVNMGQSSNDVVPTALHLSAAVELAGGLLPALDELAAAVLAKAGEVDGVVKTGRTHLMDAMPLTMGQELRAWAHQLQASKERLVAAQGAVQRLALGGTAVGTGVNGLPGFADRAIALLAEETGLALLPAQDRFAALSTLDGALELSAACRGLAVNLTKISNDLRLMNSGPLAGFGEIELQALQPGSSIMPGKVNPVIPEAVAMAAAQVIGNDATIAVAGGSGLFQLNVMLPVAADNLLDSLQLLAASCSHLARLGIATFAVRADSVERPLRRNPILVTALNPVIGYAKAAEIAKLAYSEGREVIEVALEKTDLPREELERLLDPADLTVETWKGGES